MVVVVPRYWWWCHGGSGVGRGNGGGDAGNGDPYYRASCLKSLKRVRNLCRSILDDTHLLRVTW